MKDVSQWDLLQEWMAKSSKVLIKKLSRNDCSWADCKNNHQSGVYIPVHIRMSGFFPPLDQRDSKPHIFEAGFSTFWPTTGEIKPSKLKHFSNKGSEAHMTRIPKSEFSCLSPASLLVGGILKQSEGGFFHWFIVVDSVSEEAELIETQFGLDVEFQCELFDPKLIHVDEIDEGSRLILELGRALQDGSLLEFVNSVSKLPSPEVLADRAQDIYLKKHGLKSLDPYLMQNPGDAIMKISRDIEFSLYKQAELRHRAADIVRILKGGGDDLVTSVVRGFPMLDASFLSASQHRKSRAGRSFEKHISRMFVDGGVSFSEQFVTGGRRPDFVVPSGIVLNSKKRKFEEAIVLSAKTTLRERWKQLALEKFNCSLFLATVDDRVSSDSIDDMSDNGIFLVVPESLKDSDRTCYKKKTNVLTFKDFFDEKLIKSSRSFLLM